MHQFETINRFKIKTGTILALPVLAIAILFADGIRAATSYPSSNGETLVESMNSAWTPASKVQESKESEGLDRTLKTHYIQLNDQNRLSGTISAIQKETGATIPVGELDVKLIQRSQEISVTQTDNEGQFETDVVAPGSYTLCISGSEGFLAYGIQVIENESSSDSSVPTIDLGEKSNKPKLSLVTSRLTAQEEASAVEITAAVIPPTHSALEEIMSGIPLGAGMGINAEQGTQINVKESVVAGGFQVTLQGDGNLVGRIAPLTSSEDQPIRMREMNVYLLQDDEIVDQVLADQNGNFTFNNVEPDVYGFAAAGPDGFAAISFQAIEKSEDLQSSTEPGTFQNISSRKVTKEPSEVLQVAICPASDLPYLRREIENLNRDPVNEMMDAPGSTEAMLSDQGFPPGFGGPGDFGGGFGGGDGGFGFGGGGGPGFEFGPLVGAGLAAWVASELIDDDDNNNAFFPPPVSPF